MTLGTRDGLQTINMSLGSLRAGTNPPSSTRTVALALPQPNHLPKQPNNVFLRCIHLFSHPVFLCDFVAQGLLQRARQPSVQLRLRRRPHSRLAVPGQVRIDSTHQSRPSPFRLFHRCSTRDEDKGLLRRIRQPSVIVRLRRRTHHRAPVLIDSTR